MLVKFEQNRMVQTKQNFEPFDKKWLTIFDKVLTSFYRTILWLKQLFDAILSIKRLSSFSVSKITVVRHVWSDYVEPNMADPISLKGGRMGRSEKVSLWYVALLINTRFRFLF